MNGETRKRIRLFLRRHRGGQSELAKMLGVSQPFLSQWLRGEATSVRLETDVPKCMEEIATRLNKGARAGEEPAIR